jgi:hypothetical protein
MGRSQTEKENIMSKEKTTNPGKGENARKLDCPAFNPMKIRVTDIAHHRNGVCGAPFDVALFQEDDAWMVGIVFDRESYCAVFHIEKLAAGDIAFGSNSWRGDRYEDQLRILIESHRKATLKEFLKSTSYEE